MSDTIPSRCGSTDGSIGRAYRCLIFRDSLVSNFPRPSFFSGAILSSFDSFSLSSGSFLEISFLHQIAKMTQKGLLVATIYYPDPLNLGSLLLNQAFRFPFQWYAWLYQKPCFCPNSGVFPDRYFLFCIQPLSATSVDVLHEDIKITMQRRIEVAASLIMN